MVGLLAIVLTTGISKANEATITAMKGKVTVAPAGSSGAGQPASVKTKISQGDYVRTGGIPMWS